MTRNEKGLKTIEKVKLFYVQEILKKIKENPNNLELLGQKLFVSKEKLINLLSGNETTNIAFYDAALALLS